MICSSLRSNSQHTMEPIPYLPTHSSKPNSSHSTPCHSAKHLVGLTSVRLSWRILLYMWDASGKWTWKISKKAISVSNQTKCLHINQVWPTCRSVWRAIFNTLSGRLAYKGYSLVCLHHHLWLWSVIRRNYYACSDCSLLMRLKMTRIWVRIPRTRMLNIACLKSIVYLATSIFCLCHPKRIHKHRIIMVIRMKLRVPTCPKISKTMEMAIMLSATPKYLSTSSTWRWRGLTSLRSLIRRFISLLKWRVMIREGARWP